MKNHLNPSYLLIAYIYIFKLEHFQPIKLCK